MTQDSRLIEIETKLAYQEDLIQALNDTVIVQQQQITVLEERYKRLLDRVIAGGGETIVGSAEDERPPHY